jgi:hypothetical protein
MSITTSSFSTDILAALGAYNYTRDRLPGDKISLPNSYYDIKVKVNDYVISDTINYSLDKLHDNWLYLISKSIIPSNNIPNKDYATKMLVDTNKLPADATGYAPSPKWIDTYSSVPDFIDESAQWTSVSGTSIWNGVHHFTKIQNIANPDNYNIIANTSTNLILLSGTETSSINVVGNFFNANNPIWSNSNVTHPSNELTFSNIKNHVITDNNELFVLDAGMNTIFKFDISGILTLDKSILQNDTPGRLMTGMIGGVGEVTDKTRFKSPIVIETVDNLIYTLDNTATEAVIKVFDSDLNWKRSVSIGTNAASGPIHMKYNDQTNRFYILCHQGTFAKANNNEISYTDARLPAEIVVLDRDLNYIETKQLNSTQYNTRINVERYKKVYFSEENKNIMYIVTNKNIFKKYVSRPDRFIGRFLLDEKSVGVGDSNQDFTDIIISEEYISDGSTTRQKDEILVLDEVNTTIYRFLEDSNYERSVQPEFDNKVLEFSNMQVQGDEYVSTLTYNKVLSKHLFNNTLLLENTYRKFTTKFDRNGISQYIGFRYLNSTELSESNYRVSLDCHIGNNELLLTSTINRCLNQILLLQENILDKMQEKSINIFPLITQPVMLLSPFVDFATVTGADTDGDGIFDVIDPDDDDDKLLDVEELALQTDPLLPDTDKDNLTDYEEVYPVNRPATDPTDADTDKDNVDDRRDDFPLDPTEWTDTDDDGIGDNADKDDDNDTFLDENDLFRTDPLKVDDDDSEVQLVDEDDNPTDIPVFSESGNVLTAENPDGIDDALDIDDDDDTYLDHDYTSTPNYQDRLDEMIEGVHKFRNPDYVDGVDPLSAMWLTEADPSGDTNPLKTTGKDTDDDGIDDDIDLDDDNDRLSDYEEVHTYGTDPLSADTDEDTLSDYEEVFTGEDGFITDPLSPDTDSDSTLFVGTTAIGLSGRDDKDAFPTDPAAFRDTDGDGKPDEILTDENGIPVESTTGLTEDLDDDDDNLSDIEETTAGNDGFITDSKDADTDDDDLQDDVDPDPTTPGIYLLTSVNPTEVSTIYMSEDTTIGHMLSTNSELDALFMNPTYLRDADPYTLSNDLNSNQFTIDAGGLKLGVEQDFETIGTNPLSVKVVAHDKSDNTIDLIFKVQVTDILEDTDLDTIMDDVDVTPTVAQLQFVSPDESNNSITKVHSSAVVENNIKTELLVLDDQFENPGWLHTTAPFMITQGTEYFEVEKDTLNNKWTLYLASNIDYEELPVPGALQEDAALSNVKLLIQSDTTSESDSIIDSSCNNHTISVFGQTSHDTAEAHFGSSSIHFDGTGDYLKVLDSTLGDDLDFGLDNFTIEFWIRPSAQTTRMNIIDKGRFDPGVNGNWGILVDSADNRKVRFITLDGQSNQEDFKSSTDPLANDTWHHVAIVREGIGSNQCKIYIDGTEDGQGTISKSLTNTADLRIAAGYALDNFNGYLEDIRITKGIAVYTSNFTVPGASFDNCRGGAKTISTTINAIGQETSPITKTITYSVDITNTDAEDTDSDLIDDTIDDTKYSAQLQFIAPSGTASVIGPFTAGPVVENNAQTNIIDLSTLFVNPNYIENLTITTGGEDFEIISNILYLKAARDYETSSSVSVTIEASGDEDPAVTRTITYTVAITDQDEDRDDDELLDSVDDTDLIAQLQFVDSLSNVVFASTDEATVTWPTSIPENTETDQQIIDLHTLFDNPGHLKTNPYTITSGANDFKITGNIVEVIADRDYEATTSGNITATITISGKETPAIEKTITVVATITDEAITTTGRWDDDHTTLWEAINTKWEKLSGS